MRKQLAIGVSLFLLCGVGGKSEKIDLFPIQALPLKYTHLIETSQSQTFEPYNRASLLADLPYRSAYKTVSVQFIIDGDNGDIEFEDYSIILCEQYGYTQQSCTNGLVPGNVCPYNSTYFDKCCEVKYKYNKDECVYPNTISGDSCGGKYMCYCDKSLYSIKQCPSPQVPEGEGCEEEGVTYFTNCVCPSQYSHTCDGVNQVGVGEGCTQNGVTKYQACQCRNGYNLTCSDLGPVTPSDYCLKDGIKYYKNCKTCENKCTLPSCPEGNVCEYEECSQKYCITGCAVGYKNLDDYWCNGALRCWFK